MLYTFPFGIEPQKGVSFHFIPFVLQEFIDEGAPG